MAQIYAVLDFSKSSHKQILYLFRQCLQPQVCLTLGQLVLRFGAYLIAKCSLEGVNLKPFFQTAMALTIVQTISPSCKDALHFHSLECTPIWDSRCTFLFLGLAHDCPRLYVRVFHEFTEFSKCITTLSRHIITDCR